MRASWGERGDRNLGRMDCMVARLGVRRREGCLNAEQWGYAMRRCVFCKASEACEAWLRAEGASDGYRTFCPNAAFFDRERGR